MIETLERIIELQIITDHIRHDAELTEAQKQELITDILCNPLQTQSQELF